MEVGAYIVLIIYCIWIVCIIVSWHLIPIVDASKPTSLTFDIIIPFRNENDNLPVLIASLKQIQFDVARWNVILIDDHSNDGYRLPELPPNFSLLELPNNVTSKKQALTYGIKSSSADIIVTTDADCTFNSDWLASIERYFANEQGMMVFGGVRFKKSNSFFEVIQKLEFASLIGVGAASLNIGQPIMCNGANLAFRRSAFEQVKGYHGNEHIPSGDDEFLLAKFKKCFPKGISYNKDGAGVVTTNPTQSFKEFINQRKRWSGKWSANLNWYKYFVLLLVLLSSISILYTLFFVIYSLDLFGLSLLLSKLLLDGIFIRSILKSFNQKFNFSSYLISAILYPFYVLFFAIATNAGGYTWKDRKLNNSK